MDTIVSKGQKTRERLLAIAEASVLAKGFSNTSIDEIIAAADLTKSGFFYHFKDKTELAKALLIRYIERDNHILDSIFDRAHRLSEDPLHAFLIGLKMFAEMMNEMQTVHPGCMVATLAYQDKQFNNEIRSFNREAVLSWRARFREQLDAISARYPPKQNVDLDALADMVSTVIEGGIIMSKVLDEPSALGDQVLLFRNYIRALFLGTD